MKWDKRTLGELSLNIQTGPFGSQLHQADYSETGIPVVMPKNLVNGKITEESIARVSSEHVNRLSRHKIEIGDILYSRRGDVGKCAYATEREKGWLCGTGCLRVTIDSTKADSKYIFYRLLMPETIGWVEKHAIGATMLNLNTSILSNIQLLVPSIKEQHKIVSILSAYDDLIENNQKQIKLLEEAAQRLYKEWFVDLRFPGYETTPISNGIPQGWEKLSAESFFNITIGKTPPRAENQWFTDMYKGVPWVSISDMGDCGIFIFKTTEGLTNEAVEKHKVKIIPAGTILLSFKLTVGRVSIATTNMCTNEAIAHFRLLNEQQREYVYCYLKNYHYDSLGSTSSISKAVNSKIIKAMPFVLPDDGLIEKFSKITAPLFNQILIKQKAILELKEARDRLLPKLMSGEIDVK